MKTSSDELVAHMASLGIEADRTRMAEIHAYCDERMPVPPVTDERAAFEEWAVSSGQAYVDSQYGLCFHAGGKRQAWAAWQARAALATRPLSE